MIAQLIVQVLVLSASAAETQCLPGAQVACACPAGAQGVQVCREDGLGVDSCQCPEKVSPAPVVKDLGARELPDLGRPVAGYTRQERTRTELVTAGLGTTAALYLTGGLVASSIDADGADETSHRWLYLPVVGPFISAAVPEQGEHDRYTWMLIIDGLMQVGGVAAALYGVLSPESYLLRNDLVVGPMATEDGMGLTIGGRM